MGVNDKVKNGEEKIRYLIELLKRAEGHPLSTRQLTTLMSCNRNSVNNYYNRCIKAGIPVRKCHVGHEIGYYLEQEDIYEPLTADMVRKYMIIQNIKSGAERRQDLLGVNINKNEMSRYSLIGNITVTKYYDIVNQLINEGELIQVDGRYYPSRKRIPARWFLGEEEAVEYLNILTLMPPGYHGQSVVETVFDKLNSVYGNEERKDDTYVVLGKTYELINSIHKKLTILNKADYINGLVRIKYMDDKEDMVIAVGLVVYSVEKDKLYIIGERRGSGWDGKRKNTKKDRRIFLDVERIRELKPEKGTNPCYQNKQYMDLYNKMFSIGRTVLEESEEELVVSFNNEDYIRERLENLCEYRKECKAYLEIREDKIFYHDKIIGEDDFLHFVRQFTGKYDICDSPHLNKKKEKSIRLMLKHYNEEEKE